ncbi:MAG: hypothetical protein KJ062_22520, partial [Thermoanaerobaculia bacterium]|nr:hypothetical protein [Thermoanaerobaculia bacterium]
MAKCRSGAGVLLAAAFALVASLSRPAPAQLPFVVIGLADGLPQSQLPTMAQDRDGFLWVGTLGGLARWNGSAITNFTTKDGLPSNSIEELLLDREGTLWIATVAGVARWRDRRLEPFAAAGHARCRAIAEDAEGTIWLGTEEGVLRCAGDSCTPVLGDPSDPLTVYDVLAAPRETWAATNRGLYRIDGS